MLGATRSPNQSTALLSSLYPRYASLRHPALSAREYVRELGHFAKGGRVTVSKRVQFPPHYQLKGGRSRANDTLRQTDTSSYAVIDTQEALL